MILMTFRVVGACFCEEKHNARRLYFMSIRHTHRGNEHRLTGLVNRMPDLNLPLLAHLIAASRRVEDDTRQSDQCRRKNMRSIVRLLSFWGRWHQIADQDLSLTIHRQNLQRRRQHHNSPFS